VERAKHLPENWRRWNQKEQAPVLLRERTPVVAQSHLDQIRLHPAGLSMQMVHA